MEWSKDKTLRLIELMQVNAALWNSSMCDTRRDKQKRKEELRNISEILGVSVSDINKKIQHLRTQYNRESAREARILGDPNDKYVSNWYAYDYLHFLKDTSKPYRLRADVRMAEGIEDVNDCLQHNDNHIGDCKLITFPNRISHKDSIHDVKSEVSYTPKNRDEFSVYGEYIANELRSLRGEKNLLVAKKKIQDVIFEMKMGVMINEPKQNTEPSITVYSSANSLSNGKMLYTTSTLNSSAIEQLPVSNTPATGISEIVIGRACHYSDYKVDTP